MKPLTNAAALLLVAILAHVFLWALNGAMANHRNVAHWGCEAQVYAGPTGENYAVYQSEFDWFGRRPHEWYTQDASKAFPESEIK